MQAKRASGPQEVLLYPGAPQWAGSKDSLMVHRRALSVLADAENVADKFQSDEANPITLSIHNQPRKAV